MWISKGKIIFPTVSEPSMGLTAVTSYLSHDLALGDTELEGPFDTPEERVADIDKKRQEDDWNLQEDTVTILLLDSESTITAGETMDPVWDCEDDPDYDDEAAYD
jgi:hypothetical protein